ncbi:MAG TPA: VWA domain-containing protein [Polyangiaceae bacterium]|nr:VWA domain-containing protein [Polyangiaceae bacterium]
MSGLHLLDPKGLLLLAGLVPLVVFYILKIRRRRQRVSSTWLWMAAQRDLVAKHPFRRLVPELPLLLEILALALLALALARPTSRGGAIDGDHVAIVVDTSASMATRIGGPSGTRTRIDDAKAAARGAVTRLGPGADAIVIEAARDAVLVSPPERDVQRLQNAIDGIEARDVQGDLTAAVALAADRLRSLGGRQRLVIVTDGALARDEPLAAGGIPTDVLQVGDAEDNAGIVRVDVRSGIDPTSLREQVQTFAMIQSWTPHPREAYVTLSIEGRPDPVASRRLLLQPGDKQPVVLTFEPRPEDHGAGLVVQLAPGDAEAADDAAYARVPAGPRMPVVVASDLPYSWTTRALEADPSVDLQRLTIAQLATVNIDPDALVVLESACPASVPGNDVLVIGAPAGRCFGVGVGSTVDDPPITSWDTGDARLRFLTLDGVHVAHALALDAPGSSAALVRSSATTLVADASSPGRSVTVLGFDVGDTDWPLKASFVLFVRNVVELSRAHRAQGVAGATRTGDPARVKLPAGTAKVTMDGPGVPEREIAARDGFAVLPPLWRAGLYHVRWNEPHVGAAVVPANLTSAEESDIAPRAIKIDGAAGGTSETVTHAIAVHTEWLGWLAAIAALALVLDVWWVTRQPRGRVARSR